MNYEEYFAKHGVKNIQEGDEWGISLENFDEKFKAASEELGDSLDTKAEEAARYSGKSSAEITSDLHKRLDGIIGSEEVERVANELWGYMAHKNELRQRDIIVDIFYEFCAEHMYRMYDYYKVGSPMCAVIGNYDSAMFVSEFIISCLRDERLAGQKLNYRLFEANEDKDKCEGKKIIVFPELIIVNKEDR